MMCIGRSSSRTGEKWSGTGNIVVRVIKNEKELRKAGVGAATDSRKLLESRVHGDCSHHGSRVLPTRVGRTLEYATLELYVHSTLVVVDSRVRPT